MSAAAEALLERHPRDWPRWFEEHGGRAYQGRIARRQVFQRGLLDWEAMTDLPLALRRRLQGEAPLLRSRVEAVHEAPDGAVKALLAFPGGARVEAVAMPGTAGRTLCLSTQVGCPVRCPFCASGLEGLERNLSAGEILEQALQLRRLQGPFQRVVVMGMGDAGFNLEATLRALEAILDPEGFGLGARRVTLSTVAPRGVLERLAAWGRPVQVALSLHAPDDELRQRLVPGVRKRGLEETLEEADRLFRASGREYTVEYVLLGGINDAPAQARRLAALLRGRRLHVNLIPWNPVAGLGYRRPARQAQETFARILREAGLSVTLRRSLGREAEAACGQLRRRLARGPEAV